MKHIAPFLAVALAFAACHHCPTPQPTVPCADALIEYASRYPEADAQDLYKLVFQDIYGPGHMVTDSARCAQYIETEAATMGDTTLLPDYEYTLCDSNFVRINLLLVRRGVISVPMLANAVVRSTEGLPMPDGRFVLSHSQTFKQAYRPHYRIVRREVFEREMLPLITAHNLEQ